MQTMEIAAKSVEEAKKLAAEKLGVDAEQLTVTVLEETKGLFGRSNVRIRAEVVAAPAPAPVAEPSAAPPAAPRRLGRSAKAKAEPAPEPVAEVAPAPAPVEEAPKPSRRRAPKKAEPAAEEAAPAVETTEEVVHEEVVATEADGERLADLVRELVASANLSINVRVGEIGGRYVNLIMDGKDSSFLVGKHGEVLNALQYLVNIMGGRRINNGVRATLDANDYRHRREQALTAEATRIANEVKKRGEEAVLDALPAFERRIVHKALAEIGGVATYSEGEEPNRRVVIAPAE